MRGKPIHLCHNGHPVIQFVGEACPLCAALRREAQAKTAPTIVVEHVKPEPDIKETT